MTQFVSIIESINNILWSYVLPILLLLLGSFLTFKLKAFPQRRVGHAIKYLKSSINKKPMPGSITPLAALSLALSATIGTGNIVGVLTAIRFGGPGALFWMWIVGLIGMTLKFSETTLSIRYRKLDDNGNFTGGPMYYLRDGVGSPTLAKAFSVFAITSILIGIGTFPQVHSVVDAFIYTFDAPLLLTSVLLTFAVAAITLGGLKSTARVASIVMPMIISLFILGSLFLIITKRHLLGQSFSLIFSSAFNLGAASSGATGYAIKSAIENGTRRGIFSNESGMGSAAIASATADNHIPAQQGLVHTLEVILDTLVINTLVGLLVIMTGAYTMTGNDTSILEIVYKDPSYIGQITMTVSLIFFAFTTIIAWSYYGSQCAYFLWGNQGKKLFHYLFVFTIFIASFFNWDTIWALSDFTTAILVLPNLIGLFLLRNEVVEEMERLKV